jgi:ABC-2 type transport system ATP-binding protein
MIEARDLTKHYGAVKALRGVTLDIEPGQVVGLLGPNGAGKSTFMRLVTGFLSPTSGSVRVDGVEVMDDPLACQRRIGYLPEGNPLYLEMRLREVLRFTADVRGLRGDERAGAIGAALRDAGLEEREGQLVSSFSRGYRQRVGLAMALLHRPPVLILDEPSSGLDPNQQQEMRRLIRRLGETRTVIFSTHILSEVEAVCDRAIIISAGRVVADGDVGEIRRMAAASHGLKAVVRADGEVARATFDALAFADDVGVEPHRPEKELATVYVRSPGKIGRDELEAASKAAFDAGLGVLSLDVDVPSLDIAFQRLTSTHWIDEHEAEAEHAGEHAGEAASAGGDGDAS